MFSKNLKVFQDFPVHGVEFLDICPLLLDPSTFQETINLLCERYQSFSFDKIAALEARGFFFAAPLAYKLGIGLVPIRKLGKLPGKTVNTSFTKEYGKDSFEIQADAIRPGEKVLILDDLLATGGSAKAASFLIENLGGTVVELGVLIELAFLKGRESLPFPVHAFHVLD